MATRDIATSVRTATLPRTRQPRVTSPARGPVTTPGVRPHVPHGGIRGRLGSQQVVSVRGRQVGPKDTQRNPIAAVGGIAVALLVAGIAIAMLLSGLSTSQTFKIQQLQSQERTLKNEVESLNRDLEDLRSSAHIAQEAAKSGMQVASEPGIVEVAGDGKVEQRREFNPESVSPVKDVNDEATQSKRASSDQKAINELGGSLTQLPGNNVMGAQNSQPTGVSQSNQGPALDGVAPYQPNVPATY